MYIFGRMRAFDGRNAQEVVPAALRVAETVSDVSGLGVSVWQAVYHPMGNAILWSTRIETLAALEEANATLATSEDAMQQSEQIAALMGGVAVDAVNQVVAGSMGDAPSKYVNVVSARAANSHMTEALEWGADVAEKATTLLDIPVAFTVGVFGNYGSIGWASGLEDAAALDVTRGKLMADPTLAELIDAGGHLVQSDATQILLRRMN